MDDPRLHKLGLRIQQLRQDLGWTQGQLAETTQADRSQVSRLEAGERLVSAPVLARVASALGTTVDALLAEAGFIPLATPNAQEPALGHLLRVLESYPGLGALVAAWPHMSGEQRDRLLDLWLFEQARARVAQRWAAGERSPNGAHNSHDEPSTSATVQVMEQTIRDFSAELDRQAQRQRRDGTN
jgi:transcriptional regulator with XRE-family HTH domain